jgi:tetratricopeptide (TPR) repeat protein
MTNLNETGIAGQEIQNIINISLCNKYLRKASMIKESIYDLKNPGVEINQDNTVNEIKSINDSLISIQIKCAENLYDICLTLRPDTIIVYSELFDYYTTIKDSSRTEQTFEILCTKFKNDSLIYRKIYYDLLKKGESLTDKIKYDLKYDTNEKNKKTDSLKIIYTGEAEEYFRKCLRLNPDSTDAYKNLFDLYASTGNTDKISKFYSSLTSNLKEKINLTKYILNSAVKIIKDKKYDKALVLLNSLQKNDSLNNLTNYYKAYCFSRTNKFTNAEHLLDTIITCDSLAYWAYLELGYLYYNKEKYEKSESYLLKGLLYYMYDVRENAPEVFDYTDFYYYLGLIRIIKKDKCGAVLYYNMLFKCNDAKDKSIILFRKIQEI